MSVVVIDSDLSSSGPRTFRENTEHPVTKPVQIFY